MAYNINSLQSTYIKILIHSFRAIIVLWNSANMCFSGVQTFTAIASQCTTIHNRMTSMFDIFTIN